MATTHVLEEEAVRDWTSLLARARSGEEFLIATTGKPTVQLRACDDGKWVRLSRSIELAEQHELETAVEARPDGGFAADMESVLALRSAAARSAWE